jgi:cytidine deaminase
VTASAEPGSGEASDPVIDWTALQALAQEAAQHAYCPYSKFAVGAAGLVDDGRTVAGCNVENVSFGLTLCAECGLVGDLHRSGGGRLVAVAIVSGSGEPCTPCGRCRQLLFEHGGPDCQVWASDVICTVADLLPDGFTSERLAQG